jgi:hypothetical protein
MGKKLGLWTIYIAIISVILLLSNVSAAGWPVPNLIHHNFNIKNNLVKVYNSTTDKNYNDIGFANIAGTKANDFDLIKPNSPAVEAGATISGNELDFLNRSRPNGNGPDIGAFEYYAPN